MGRWICLVLTTQVDLSFGAGAVAIDGQIDFPDPTPPPEQPPDVYLLHPRSGDKRQQALLVLSQWTISDEIVTHSLTDVPIERPTPLDVSGSGAVLIRIAAKSAPLQITVNHYDEVRPDGHHTGGPAPLIAWRHPIVFPNDRAAESARLLKYLADGDPPGWELAVQLPVPARPGGESYLRLWAQWFVPPPYPQQGGTHSANWTMSARRQDFDISGLG